MADWRIGKKWTKKELHQRLQLLRHRNRNFWESESEMTLQRGWHKYSSEALIARAKPGVPEQGSSFERAKTAVANFEFSDPRIVVGHFDMDAPLLGRFMLLEIQALYFLHYLGGTVVGEVRSEQKKDRTVFGFRYDTLEGHIERGVEWFLLTKDHKTGEIFFRIESLWRPGEFPNWWSRLGFSLVGRYYQKHWHRNAHRRLRRIAYSGEPQAAGGRKKGFPGNLPDIVYNQNREQNVKTMG